MAMRPSYPPRYPRPAKGYKGSIEAYSVPLQGVGIGIQPYRTVYKSVGIHYLITLRCTDPTYLPIELNYIVEVFRTLKTVCLSDFNVSR